jgi:hypothetical protein
MKRNDFILRLKQDFSFKMAFIADLGGIFKGIQIAGSCWLWVILPKSRNPNSKSLTMTYRVDYATAVSDVV